MTPVHLRAVRDRMLCERSSRFIGHEIVVPGIIAVRWREADGRAAEVVAIESIAWAAAAVALREDSRERVRPWTDEERARR